MNWTQSQKMFKDECEHAVEISHRNLKKLLSDNAATEYGKEFQFSDISTVEEYQKMVPLSDYSDYGYYVERMISGEQKVLSVYEPKHFILSSGSTGQQKHIPLSKEALKRCADAIYYAGNACLEGMDKGPVLHMSVFRMDLSQKEKETILSAAFFRELHDRGTYGLDQRYLGGEDLLFTKDIGDVPFVKLWLLLSSPELVGIQAFFLYDILLFFHYFEEHWEEMIEWIRIRKIPDAIVLSESIRNQLLKISRPDEQWLCKVETECRNGFSGIMKRLWSDMKWISGVGGSSFFAQESMVREYLGDVPIHYFSYAASECMMAITDRLDSPTYTLIPQSGFYEFIPYGETDECVEKQICTIENVEAGKLYELVLTNFSGFYRYQLGDVIKVTGFQGEAPIIEVCFRKNQALNIAGEKMDMQTVAKAMELFANQLNIRIREFSFLDDKSDLPGHYVCFFETQDECAATSTEMSLIMDRIFRDQNVDYDDVRNLGMISLPEVLRVPSGTHTECKKQFGSRQAQNKPLQYLSNASSVEFMRERAI